MDGGIGCAAPPPRYRAPTPPADSSGGSAAVSQAGGQLTLMDCLPCPLLIFYAYLYFLRPLLTLSLSSSRLSGLFVQSVFTLFPLFFPFFFSFTIFFPRATLIPSFPLNEPAILLPGPRLQTAGLQEPWLSSMATSISPTRKGGSRKTASGRSTGRNGARMCPRGNGRQVSPDRLPSLLLRKP